MMKKFEQDYIKHIDSSAPDMDKLWEKIAGAPDEEKDITPFVSASRQCAHKSGKTVRIFVSAAAVLAAVFCAGRLIISDSEISSETSQADMAPEISDEYAADEAEIPSVAAEMGWDYSTETQSADNYYTLDLAETDSGIYNALSHSEAEQEYFVEAQVLSETDFFIDGKVLYSDNEGDMTAYTLEVVHLISDSEASLPEKVTVYSDSPYALRDNREYLLPISASDGMYRVVFDNAPQIEITLDREVVYHNGWQSLAADGSAITYPQVYKDDYFYDRMNITAECSLEKLFESWEKLRA